MTADDTKPLRVTHVISGLDRTDGGPTTALLELARASARLNADVTVVATPRRSSRRSIVQELRDSGVRVRLHGFRHPTFTSDAALQRLLTEEIACADVVHIHALWEQIQYQAATVSRALGIPFVVRPCGLLDSWSMSRRRFKKRLYLELRLRRLLNAAAALHFSTAMELEAARPLRFRCPSIVEPNGVDLDEYRRSSEKGNFRRRLGVCEKVPIALFLGRIHPKKGLDLLIPAFADAAPPESVLAIVGTGEPGYEAYLRRLAVSLHIEDRVRFVGLLEGRERIAALVDSDVFALPSRSENFANAVLESIAAGTPVIVSDQVGLHPEITAWRVGEVVSTDQQALAEALRIWLTSRERRRIAFTNAGEFLAPYEVHGIAARWLQRYREFSRPLDETAA